MIFHLLRITCFALLVVGLHWCAIRPVRDATESGLSLVTLKRLMPEAASLIETSSQLPVWEVRDTDGRPTALVCLTSPMADQVVGYAGPNNILLVMNLQGQVTEAHWLEWLDTHDHVQRVSASENFWQQFHGRTLGDSSHPPVDGVSGATLTSLAIAEAIDLRLTGARPSLRFPDAINLEEVQSCFPEAMRMEADKQQAHLWKALDQSDRVMGSVMRTGPLVDNKIGYQGPTELLIAIDRDDRVVKIKLRGSFDNQPYVRYTRMEASFWAKFVGRTLTEISQIDLAAEGIEGVSGATMTSTAAAETVRVAAQRHLEQLTKLDVARPARTWNWSIGELATGVLALLLVPWSFSRWRGERRYRLAWQLLVILIVVGLSGNLISMALLAGWTRSLPPWSLAPGLVMLVAISLAMPALLGRNAYCDHVCPHGIAQQWLSRWTRRRQTSEQVKLVTLQVKPSTVRAKSGWKTILRRALRLSGTAILCLSMGWIVWTVPKQLTFFEPFDVYAWRIGWSVSLGVWIASLLWAIKEPMGYCRHACPTGMLLESIRLKRTGKRWQSLDMLLVALTISVWIYACWRAW